MFKLPRLHIRGRVIYIVFNIASAFEHQCFQPFLTKFFCCPASADAGADNNGIEGILRCSVYIKVHPKIVFKSLPALISTAPLNVPGIILYPNILVMTYSEPM